MFGPFLSPNGKTGEVCPEILHCGYDLEFATAERSFRVCIYRRVVQWRAERINLEDYVFHEHDAPVDVMSIGAYVAQTPAGRFFPVQAILLNLFTKCALDGLERCLGDFRECLPLTASRSQFNKLDVEPDCTRADLLARGFRIDSFFSYGRGLSAHLIWVFPQDRVRDDGLKCFLSACDIEFRPRPDRTLNSGKWIEPLESFFPGVLQKLLKSIEPVPARVLSERGLEVALNSFEWTPLTLMSADEARRARIEFIRKNADLVKRPEELARALRREQLYAKSTTPAKIVKSLPSLIKAAVEGV